MSIPLSQQVINGQQDVQIVRLLNPNVPQILALRKNEAFEQILLKRFAKQNHLTIWSLYLENPKLNTKLQLITINAVNYTEVIKTTVQNFTATVKHLETIFTRIYQVPFWVRMGKFLEFNAYGMHEIRNEHECQLCFTQMREGDNLLNCCGKIVCRECRSKYFKQEQHGRICPFCKQPQLLNMTIAQLLEEKALLRIPFQLPQTQNSFN